MSGKSNYLQNSILALIFEGTTLNNIANNAASSPLTNLYVALHTADPTNAGNQTTSECSYTGYARIAVARTSGGWTVSGSSPTQVAPVANIYFGSCTAISQTAEFWSIGTAPTGAGELLYVGPITPNISITPGVQPFLTTASTVTED
jgi:hypothetical protein